jgi:hypothetical protein
VDFDRSAILKDSQANVIAIAIFCGLILLGQCTYYAAGQVKSGLESVSKSIDRLK